MTQTGKNAGAEEKVARLAQLREELREGLYHVDPAKLIEALTRAGSLTPGSESSGAYRARLQSSSAAT
jgi:hypothetical protein